MPWNRSNVGFAAAPFGTQSRDAPGVHALPSGLVVKV